MVNSEELIDATEYLTLQSRCRINRYRYNRVLLYIELQNKIYNFSCFHSDSCSNESYFCVFMPCSVFSLFRRFGTN
jgi:hypothetical protein